MKRRSALTPFRKSQVRIMLEAVVRGVFAHTMGGFLVRDVMRELVADDAFWADVGTSAPLTVVGTATLPAPAAATTPIGDNGTRVRPPLPPWPGERP